MLTTKSSHFSLKTNISAKDVCLFLFWLIILWFIVLSTVWCCLKVSTNKISKEILSKTCHFTNPFLFFLLSFFFLLWSFYFTAEFISIFYDLLIWLKMIKCSGTKFVAIINCFGLFKAIFSLYGFCAFLEYSFTSQVLFSRFRSSFLSDLVCFYCLLLK